MKQERELSEALLGDEQGRKEVLEALREITARTADNAGGDVGVGLSILVGGEVHSIGATTDFAQTMDEGQAQDGDGPCLEALDTAEFVKVGDYVTDERWPSTSTRAAQTGVRSSLSLPLRTGDQVLGALNVYSSVPDAFNPRASARLAAFAQQATTSLSLLGQMQDQREGSSYVREFSETMQSGLHTVLPQVEGLELTGASVPAAPHATVGGDWYDAFVLQDGSLGLVIGDVMGHGIEAVIAMSQVRTLVRAGAWAGKDPCEVLEFVDQLVQQNGILEVVTLFYAHLESDGARWQLRYCNAGHPYPLLRQPDGTVTELRGGERTLLGVLATTETPPSSGEVGTTDLAPGALLVLYTDGLVERSQGEEEQEAETMLLQLVRGHEPGHPLEGLKEQLLTTRSPDDDTTVFTLRVDDLRSGAAQ